MKFPLEFECKKCSSKPGKLCDGVHGTGALHINRERQARAFNELEKKKELIYLTAD